ncbi:hypothetical protein SAMN05421771_0584 [Granulicella pectinivorans]|jgi:hypothetical protein|uniref:Zinc-ribbon domain-containing protein n=1 Tax=Granulicella pectinivorans TaxID=474950 RepID=A0A1I6LDC8_9BACT|nr:zinc ribbon domain-containing protein [Granulicella pectinivorans]SFS01501.1 hypothetical protein SAMN05421771_0584 [Granulicella pectinivorans]
MPSFCHRCHGELPPVTSDATFCPHCGAPQLRVIEENVVALPATPIPSTTGAAPPPSPGGLHWNTIVALAAIVAGVATVMMAIVFLLPGAFPIAWLWTVSGAVIVLGLYQRRHPETPLNAGLGARVGIVYGLLAISSLAILTAVSGVVARYGLHHMGPVDTWLTSTMHQAMEQQLQQLQSSGKASDPALSPDQMRAFFYSPEVRAGLSLAMLSVSALFLVGFSALGGAIGGILRTRRR